MATFKDRLGREWAVELTVGALPRLRAAGLDVSAAYRDPEKFGDLLVLDPETLGRGLYELCGDQAARAGVSPEQFADGFDGPALAAATDALIAALVDFRHRPAVAAALKPRVLSAVTKLEGAMATGAAEAMDRAMTAADSTSNPSAGGSPGPSGSTPAP